MLPDANILNQLALINAIQEALSADAAVQSALDALDLQPTPLAWRFAAHAAVIVLLAHDLGHTSQPEPEQARGGGKGRTPKAPKAKAKRKYTRRAVTAPAAES